MTNRYLLGAGVALAVALGGAQAHAQLFPWNQQGVAGAWYIGPEGGWTSLNSNNSGTVSGVSFTGGPTVVPLPPRGLGTRKGVSTAASMPAPAAASSGARGALRKNTATGITGCPRPG